MERLKNGLVLTPEDKMQHGREPLRDYVGSVFLAGSIEQGTADHWQRKVYERLSDAKMLFFNPRRELWNGSLEQSQNNAEFNYQVNWELDNIEKADIVFMYFDPDTYSPISLLEFGMLAKSGKMLVTCPTGFWRKGNVELMCTRFKIPLYHTLENGIGALRTLIHLGNY